MRRQPGPRREFGIHGRLRRRIALCALRVGPGGCVFVDRPLAPAPGRQKVKGQVRRLQPAPGNLRRHLARERAEHELGFDRRTDHHLPASLGLRQRKVVAAGQQREPQPRAVTQDAEPVGGLKADLDAVIGAVAGAVAVWRSAL